MTADLFVTLGWGALGSLVLMLVVLGAAPVFAVRLIGLLYPTGHPRRLELRAEIEHVKGLSKILEQWLWLGEMFAVGICDGLPSRTIVTRRRYRRMREGLREAEFGSGWIYYSFIPNDNRKPEYLREIDEFRKRGEIGYRQICWYGHEPLVAGTQLVRVFSPDRQEPKVIEHWSFPH